MQLRDAQAEDAAALAALFTRSVRELGTECYTAEQLAAWAPAPPDLAVWRRRLDELHTIIAETDGAPLGFVAYAPYAPSGYIDLIYTDPGAARSGVASALLHEAAARLRRDHGVEALSTDASLIAVPFFQRHGFVALSEQHVVRHGVTLRRFAMCRSAADGAG